MLHSLGSSPIITWEVLWNQKKLQHCGLSSSLAFYLCKQGALSSEICIHEALVLQQTNWENPAKEMLGSANPSLF